MDELLDQSLKNIEQQTRSREIENNEQALVESIQEIENSKLLVKEFTKIRNQAINNLYNVGISAKRLSEITGISTVYIHRIVK
tara:strand:- start:37 stop:285 length:249 start_codon:yes stop_codon:yes gene_type:complete